MKRAAAVISVVVAGLGMCAWSLGQSTDKPAAAGQTAAERMAIRASRRRALVPAEHPAARPVRETSSP